MFYSIWAGRPDRYNVVSYMFDINKKFFNDKERARFEKNGIEIFVSDDPDDLLLANKLFYSLPWDISKLPCDNDYNDSDKFGHYEVRVWRCDHLAAHIFSYLFYDVHDVVDFLSISGYYYNKVKDIDQGPFMVNLNKYGRSCGANIRALVKKGVFYHICLDHIRHFGPDIDGICGNNNVFNNCKNVYFSVTSIEARQVKTTTEVTKISDSCVRAESVIFDIHAQSSIDQYGRYNFAHQSRVDKLKGIKLNNMKHLMIRDTVANSDKAVLQDELYMCTITGGKLLQSVVLSDVLVSSSSVDEIFRKSSQNSDRRYPGVTYFCVTNVKRRNESYLDNELQVDKKLLGYVAPSVKILEFGSIGDLVLFSKWISSDKSMLVELGGNITRFPNLLVLELGSQYLDNYDHDEYDRALDMIDTYLEILRDNFDHIMSYITFWLCWKICPDSAIFAHLFEILNNKLNTSIHLEIAIWGTSVDNGSVSRKMESIIERKKHDFRIHRVHHGTAVPIAPRDILDDNQIIEFHFYMQEIRIFKTNANEDRYKHAESVRRSRKRPFGIDNFKTLNPVATSNEIDIYAGNLV